MDLFVSYEVSNFLSPKKLKILKWKYRVVMDFVFMIYMKLKGGKFLIEGKFNYCLEKGLVGCN